MYQALQCDCNIVIPRREVEVDSCFICTFQIHHSFSDLPAHFLNPLPTFGARNRGWSRILSWVNQMGHVAFLSIIGTCDNCYVL
jgi:hypothetical protein